MLGSLRINEQRPSRVVVLSITGHNPQVAARVANGYARAFIEQSLMYRFQNSAEASTWLKDQVGEQQKKIEGAQNALQKMRDDQGIAHVEERRALLVQRIQDLGVSLSSIRTQRLQKDAVLRQMRSASDPTELPDVMRSEMVQSLRAQQSALQTQLTELREKYLEEHPDVVKVKAQLSEVNRRIAGEAQAVIRSVDNECKAALAQENVVSRELDEARQEAEDLGHRATDYDAKKREVEAASVVLNGLLSRNKETDVAQEMNISNIRIMDPAIVPRSPILPNRPRDIVQGALLGLVLGIGLALFLEYLDNSVTDTGGPAPPLGRAATGRDPGELRSLGEASARRPERRLGVR